MGISSAYGSARVFVGPLRSYVCRFLDTTGDGTGEKDAIGDYSSVEKIFFIQPSDIQTLRITRLLVSIEDEGPADAGSYGNAIDLINGIQVQIRNNSGVLIDLTDGSPIFTNSHWARYTYDVRSSSFGAGGMGMGLNYVFARWSFLAAGIALRLRGDQNERLSVILNDDFSGLVSHRFVVQGFFE